MHFWVLMHMSNRDHMKTPVSSLTKLSVFQGKGINWGFLTCTSYIITSWNQIIPYNLRNIHRLVEIVHLLKKGFTFEFFHDHFGAPPVRNH